MKKREKSVSINKRSIWRDKGSWELLLLCLPALIGYILFNYIPMAAAITIPFKDYQFSKGIWGSAWCGLKNFKWLLHIPDMGRILRNTVGYGAWFLFIGPLTNMIIALLLFEIKSRGALKTYQTIITFPNFMSMVVVGYVAYVILSPTAGVMNQVLKLLGKDPIDVYMRSEVWPLILTIVTIWKDVGMGSMMYYASLMGIDPSLYEAAEVDGASRFQKMLHISVPHLIPLVCLFMIMGAGSLFSSNFDLFYIIPRDSTVLYPTTDVLSTYVYRALKTSSYAVGATVDLVKSIAGLIMVVVTNLIVKKISPENSLF